MTLTPIAERLVVQLLLPVFTTSKFCRGWDSNSHPSALRGERSNRLRHRHGDFASSLLSHLPPFEEMRVLSTKNASC